MPDRPAPLTTVSCTIALSVIIPVRNGAATLAPLLDSLNRAHTEGINGCEFIVVDDGSTDATAAIIADYPWLRVVRHPEPRGAGGARNSGARVARGELLLFLDADTRLREPELLRRCCRFFTEHPAFDAVSGRYYEHNPTSHRFARYLDAVEAAMQEAALDRETPGTLSGCLCALRRHVFNRLGGFSEDPRVVLEDPDLGCRLSAAGHRLWFSADLCVEHRQPGLWHYCRELIPRTRHYIHLIRHYGSYIEAMGGRREGVGRLLYFLALPLLAAGLFIPPLAWPGGAALLAAGYLSRGVVRRLFRRHQIALLPSALFFHLVTSGALIIGGGLGVLDGLRATLQRRWIDLAVVYAYLKSLLHRRAVGQLTQFVTHRCNAHCDHCFDTPQRQRIGAGQELDLPRIQQLATTIGPIAHLSLTGGEPLLRDDLAEIIAAYYRAGVRSISLSSNGSYPERLATLIARLPHIAPRARLMLTLSFDAIGQPHDRLRGLPGLYEKAERSLALLCQARQWTPQLRVHACITLSQANADQVETTIARLAGWQLDQLELNRLRGSPANPQLAGIDEGRYATAAAAVGAANGGSRGLAGLFARLDRLMAQIVRHPQQPWPCGGCLAGRRLAIIQADGTVLPCEMLQTTRPDDAARFNHFSLGNLGNHGDNLTKLLATPQSRRLTDYIRESECRCSFECAIFTTIAYRPWRLWRFFTAPSRPAAADAPVD